MPSFAQEQIGTGTSLPSHPSLKVKTEEVTPSEPSGLAAETAAAGESRVRRFMRQAMRHRTEGGASLGEAYLTGDPWSTCEDLAEEDHVEWFMDFFRRRDAARPERPEDLVTRALARDKPPTRYRRRLEAIVREPIHLLDPVLLEDASRRSTSIPGSPYTSESASPRRRSSLDASFVTERSCAVLDGTDDATGSTMSPGGRCSTFSLASFASSESASESRASFWLSSSPPPSSVGISEVETTSNSPTHRSGGPHPKKASDAWEMEFIVQCALDEVWRRLKEGHETQDISQLLIDTRRHLVTYQVRRQRGLAARSS